VALGRLNRKTGRSHSSTERGWKLSFARQSVRGQQRPEQAQQLASSLWHEVVDVATVQIRLASGLNQERPL
jgi:hypothetical protein